MRLLWRNLWIIPLVAFNVEVLVAELGKLIDGGKTVYGLALTSSIVAVLFFFGRRLVLTVPKVVPTEPDAALTTRSRELARALNTPAIRVFVAASPRSSAYLWDGSDLILSERLARLPEDQRDFLLAWIMGMRATTEQRSLLGRGIRPILATMSFVMFVGSASFSDQLRDALGIWGRFIESFMFMFFLLAVMLLDSNDPLMSIRASSSLLKALRTTQDVKAARSALLAFATTDSDQDRARNLADNLETEWREAIKVAATGSAIQPTQRGGQQGFN